MMSSSMGQEVSISKANLSADEAAYDVENAKGAVDGTVEKLSTSLRLFRQYSYFEFRQHGWGKPMTLIMYATYVLVAALVSANNATTTPPPGIQTMIWVCYGIWIALSILNDAYFSIHLSQAYRMTGIYRALLDSILKIGTIVVFRFSFRDGTMSFTEYGLLIVMAGGESTLDVFRRFYLSHCTHYTLLSSLQAIFVDERIINPRFEKMYCFYHGAISKQEVKEGVVPPIAGIGNSALLKIAANAGKALRFSDEAIKTVQQVIGSLRIREEETEALDDWTLVMNKLTHAVSFAPSFCTPKSKLSAAQCQQLTEQMILFLRDYIQTGKISSADDLNRTTALNFLESLAKEMKLCMQAPFFFFIAILPRTGYGVINSALVPKYTGKFIDAVVFQNRAVAMQSLIVMVILGVFGPAVNLVTNYVEPLFVKKMISATRKKMLRSTLKGGTQFGEKFRPGKLNDSFSSQLTQFEQYSINFFLPFAPQLAQLVAGVWVSASEYTPAVYLFISLVPVMFSVGYFEERAIRASARKAQIDATVSGRVTSAVECRDAIRAANASDWVAEDMKELLQETDNYHFSSFFRSGLAETYIQVMIAIYSYIIVLPLGLGIINGKLTLGTFSVVMGAMSSMIAPIAQFSMFSKMTTQFSGAIQSVSALVDDSLNEKPSSKSSGTTSTLTKLASSLSIKNIKFRYSSKLPDVIKGVNIGLSPGTYSVLMGGSGSGKSTVLSLLMRFREPSEGTVEWDGKDIYGTSLESFRENVGVMFQKTMIYQGTIRDNILFGKPEVSGDVEKAARAAEIADIIERLPDQYDTVIGGDALAGMSGGQLQRVCLARALYRKPSVLLLDEATSALDAETERSIIETLVRLRDTEGLTLVSVTHHPSTAVKADKIVVLEKGVIAEEGTYDELMSREGGLFKKMAEAGE